MNAHDAIKTSLQQSDGVWKGYTDDLGDTELLVRPTEGANHVAWQLGHLIASEHGMISQLKPGSMPALPEDFADRHSGENSSSDDPADFLTKDEYLQLFQQQRTATLTVLEEYSAEELDAESPEALRGICRTVGSIFLLQAAHYLMHAGQWAVIRRGLGRPPLF